VYELGLIWNHSYHYALTESLTNPYMMSFCSILMYYIILFLFHFF